jgi:signal peptidase II
VTPVSTNPEGVAQVADVGVVAGAPARAGSAAIALRFAVVGVIIALDLWSKSAVFAWLEQLDAQRALIVDECGHRRYPLIGEWLTLMLSLNPGAAFGQLDSVPWLLVGGRCIAAGFLIWLILRTPRGKPVFTTALVLILGGALGNLYDNLLRARGLVLDGRYDDHPFGPVRDFIDVYFDVWKWHFPTFNVADSCITVGAVLLLASSFFTRNAKAG